MGCVSSKKARSDSPEHDFSSSSSRANRSSRSNALALLRAKSAGFGPLEKIKEEPEEEEEQEEEDEHEEELITKRKTFGNYSGSLKVVKRATSGKKAGFSFKFGRLTEGEHASAGWPAWLSAVAGEAINGWLPMRADSFQRLEKIGQGTYSSVYRARNVDTGKMVALKKVRFDNFQPESVRFMAREITILRRLDHPNIMKLEGIITSRLSCSIYLVFEYMEHDLSGLLSCPEVKFSDSQIKCYMQQLLHGLEHCHSRGVIHRDIKSSNILVNNDGILKIADFGLANFMSSKNKHPLTSRVVTLWYRPPELLLGSTNYGEAVDLWSVGCVFAELFIGRPLLKGRTEVEQLHKIFKLCGSPPDEYWRKSRLPLASMFKPQHPYESTLRERCKEFPKSAVNLLECFLSIEPTKRGTAAYALESEYFNTKPYACHPSTLPKYPPNKEIDAKYREEMRRKRAGGAYRASGARNPRRMRRTLQESSTFNKATPSEESEADGQFRYRYTSGSSRPSRGRGGTDSRMSMKSSYDTMSEASQMTEESQADSIKSVPIKMPASSDFAWAKRQQEALARIYGNHANRSQKLALLDPSSVLQGHDNLEPEGQDVDDYPDRFGTVNGGFDRRQGHVMRRQKTELTHVDSFGSSDVYDSGDFPMDYSSRKGKGGYSNSGPLLYQSQRMDERLDNQPRQALPRSRFYRDP